MASTVKTRTVTKTVHETKTADDGKNILNMMLMLIIMIIYVELYFDYM